MRGKRNGAGVRWAALAYLALGLTLQRSSGADNERDEAQRKLATKGLTRVGDAWCHADEMRLREAVEVLDGRERVCMSAPKRVEQFIQQDDAAIEELRQAQATLTATQDLAKTVAAGSPQRTQADAEIKRVSAVVSRSKQRIADPRNWGAFPPLKPLLDEWAQSRQELMLSVQVIRELAPGLDEKYRPLRTDREIESALRTLGGANHLGPARSYEKEVQRAATVEQSALRGPVPVTREGSHYRVATLLNDRTPATFSVHDRSDPVLIPATLAETAGIQIPPDASITSIRPAPNRQLTVRAVTLPRLRIGRWTLRDVAAYVLPPEGEDLGAQLNRDALATQRISLDTRRMILNGPE